MDSLSPRHIEERKKAYWFVFFQVGVQRLRTDDTGTVISALTNNCAHCVDLYKINRISIAQHKASRTNTENRRQKSGYEDTFLGNRFLYVTFFFNKFSQMAVF